MITPLPAAVLFDMDGTLVDSELLWDLAMFELAERYGGVLSDADRLAMVGNSMGASMLLLHTALGQTWRDVEKSSRWMEGRMVELFATRLVWRPGARELLHAVRAAGIPTALVTSTVRSLVEVALDTLGRENFDVVVPGDEVKAPKPDPEPYRLAAELLGVPVGRCVVIEDSPTGVASAVAAGAAVMAVRGVVAIDPAVGVPVVETLDGVDLAFLADLVG